MYILTTTATARKGVVPCILTYPTGLEFCLLVLLTAERRWRTLSALGSSDLLLATPRHPLPAAPPIACCCDPPPLHRQGLLPAALCRRELQLSAGSSSALAGITTTAWVQAITPDERGRTCLPALVYVLDKSVLVVKRRW